MPKTGFEPRQWWETASSQWRCLRPLGHQSRPNSTQALSTHPHLKRRAQVLRYSPLLSILFFISANKSVLCSHNQTPATFVPMIAHAASCYHPDFITFGVTLSITRIKTFFLVYLSTLTLAMVRLLSSYAQERKDCWYTFCYSLDSLLGVLSDEYPYAMVSVISQDFCIILYWPTLNHQQCKG